MKLKAQIESILFIAVKPIGVSDLTKVISADKKEIEKSLKELQEDYSKNEAGLQIISTNKKYQMTSAADNADLVKSFLQEETSGELSQPSLETLTIIAYRGPISKIELERIRGVNCSLILRNLLLRGLVEEQKTSSGTDKSYVVTLEFLRFLGIEKLEQLPDYEKLNKDQTISDFLNGSLKTEDGILENNEN
ncbi:SMC-Scp complex subunit ScpB [bacterium]|nr:SMC-Scp complex subunit ScpB [bacterium]